LVSLGVVVQIHAAETPRVKVDWLDHAAPTVATGVSFGLPWPRGAVQKGESLHLIDAKGQSIPLQSWPMAYWPDGSLKWTGHAIGASSKTVGPLTIQPGKPAAPTSPLVTRQTADAIEIINGNKTWRIATKGQHLVDSITIDKQTVA